MDLDRIRRAKGTERDSADTGGKVWRMDERPLCHENKLPAVVERLRRAYPAILGQRVGVGSIPANSDALNVPSYRRWRFEMKLSPFNPSICMLQQPT